MKRIMTLSFLMIMASLLVACSMMKPSLVTENFKNIMEANDFLVVEANQEEPTSNSLQTRRVDWMTFAEKDATKVLFFETKRSFGAGAFFDGWCNDVRQEFADQEEIKIINKRLEKQGFFKLYNQDKNLYLTAVLYQGNVVVVMDESANAELIVDQTLQKLGFYQYAR